MQRRCSWQRNHVCSPSVKVVTELQLTIETMLQAAANPITHKRHIPYQMLIARNAKIHGLYITLFVVISCSGVDLTIDANFQSAVASKLRRHVHDVIMAGDGPSVLLTSEHVIPVLIEHKKNASTWRACDSVSTQKRNGCSERLTEKNYMTLRLNPRSQVAIAFASHGSISVSRVCDTVCGLHDAPACVVPLPCALPPGL